MRRTRILATAALAGLGLHALATYAGAQNLVTWTGAVNNTWDAQTTSFTGTLNWTSGGSPTFYSHRDNAVFTDNFAGVGTLNMVAIDVGTISVDGGEPNSVGMDPTSVSFRHIAGSTPTFYLFQRFRNGDSTGTANSTAFGPATTTFGGGTTSLALESGFLGHVAIQTRANTQSFGTTTINSGVLEINDALALPGGLNNSGTLSNNFPNVVLNGGELRINVTTGGNSNPASTNLAGTLTVSSDSRLTTATTNNGNGDGANTTSLTAPFTNIDSRAWNGTITIATSATLTLESLGGGQMQFTASGNNANIDLSTSTGTLALANNTRARFENARASMPNGALNLGTGAAIYNNNLGDVNGTISLGALFGGASTQLLGSNSGHATQRTDTYVIGGKNVDSTYAGLIGNGTATTNLPHMVSVVKDGSGVFTPTGANTYTGATGANAGTIALATIGNGGVAGNAGAGTQLILNGGAIKYTGAAASSDRELDIRPGGGILDASGGGLTVAGAVATTEAPNRGITYTAADNVATLTQNVTTGLGNSSDLRVGMTVSNGTALLSGPLTITAIGNGTITLSAPADMTVANSSSSFGPWDRSVTLAGTSSGVVSQALADSAAGSKLGVVKSGTGAWTLNGVNTNTGGTSATGGTLTIGSAGQVGPGALSANGGTVVFAAGNATGQKVASLAITGTAVDLNDNDMVVGSATPTSAVATAIRNARNGGNWNGSGLTSSSAKNSANHNTTLGVLTGAEYTSVGGTGTFSGQSYAASDSLVKYTWYGDTDFNGKVNFDDYVRTDNGFNGHLTGWLNGDFDLNGQVNFDDYVLIDLAFNTQSGTLGRALSFLTGGDTSLNGMNNPSLKEVAEHAGEFGDGYVRGFLSAVPEPASLSLIAGVGGLLAGRRRRRSSR